MTRLSHPSLKVSVVVTVLNEQATIIDLLKSLSQQTLPPSQVIIVDGGSTDQTVELLRQYQQQHHDFPLEILTRHGNRSVGRNWGIRKSIHELIAITDAGCMPQRDWLEQIIRCYVSSEKRDSATSQNKVIAGYYQAALGTPFQEAAAPYFLVMPDRVNTAHFLPATRSMLLPKSVWRDLGGFDERFTHNEDYAFAHKLLDHKITITFAPGAIVSWLPPPSLRVFDRCIYRFAQGDIYAGIFRPKVGLIFARYIFLSLLILAAKYDSKIWLVVFLSTVLYILWSVAKNIKYTPRGWFYLPILQVVSDVLVMCGSLVGAAQYLYSKLMMQKTSR